MKISIITIVYNAVDTIEKTIKSVITEKQFFNMEYIVIDGKSNDGTLDVIKKYSKHIDIFISEKDNGLYDALNKGIKKANGEYVIMLAADDSLLRNSISFFLDSIKQNTDVWSGSLIYKKNEDFYLMESNKDLSLLKTHCSLRHPATFFKKESFDKYGYYNTEYKIAGDRELFLRFYNKGATFQVESFPIVYFSINGISNTRIDKTKLEDYKISINNGMNRKKANFYYLHKPQRKNIYIIKLARLLFGFINIYSKSYQNTFLFQSSSSTIIEHKKIDKKELIKYGLPD